LIVYLIPFISALIGWFTNFIAVKMLFHPREPVRLAWFHFQGIFPKRQHQIAENLGKVVATELLSTHELKDKLLKPENIKAVHNSIAFRLHQYLSDSLPQKYPMIALIVSGKTKDKVMDEVMREIYNMTPSVIDELMEKVDQSVNIEAMVRDKVSQFPASRLEDMLHQLLKKEFRFIEWIGAILGFIIGCLQLLLLYWQGHLPTINLPF